MSGPEGLEGAGLPEGWGDVEVVLTRDMVSASAVVDAPAEEVFEYVRRPANHAAISGDHSVRASISGPEALSLGDRFGVSMRIVLPYRITNKVVEFEPGRRIAWSHVGGHRWRWQIEPEGEGRCRATETFDLSTARFPPALRLVGYPKGHEKNVAASVANLVSHFARS